MSAQLSPTPVQKFFDNNGFPAAFGTLGTFAAGTNTPQATYVDSTQTTPNTNPVVLNFRGECNLWLDPTKSYKFVLKDFFGILIWTVDNIPGGFSPGAIGQSLIPIPTNTWTLGSPTNSWANMYLGPNAAPALDVSTGNILYYARTPAEVSAAITPTNFTYPPGQARRYGAIPNNTGVDCTAAFNNALIANQDAFESSPGTYRIDGTITINAQQELRLWKGVKLQRQSAATGATVPVVHIKGLYAKCFGGIIESQNDAPGGVVCCGHLNTTTSNWNSLWWHLSDCDINCKDYLGAQGSGIPITGITQANPAVVTAPSHGLANGAFITIRSVVGMTQVNSFTFIIAGVTTNTFQLTGNGITSSGNINSTGYTAYSSGGAVFTYPTEGQSIGVYAPSSQPQLGPSFTNYYGRITNVHVQTATTPFWLTDLSNAHELTNINWNGMYWNGLVLQGSYGNRAIVGFCDSAYQNGTFAIYLRIQGSPGAPFASGIGTSRNHVLGGTFELGTNSNFGCFVSQADGKQTNNFVEFAWNTSGTAIADTAALNTIIELSSTVNFQNSVATQGSVTAQGTIAAQGSISTQAALSTNGATPTGTGTIWSLGNTVATTVGAAGGAAALPATPLGYWVVDFGGSKVKIPYYRP